MIYENIDLKHLYIKIPTSFEKGEPKEFKYKSIADILKDQDIFEVCSLQSWICDQILKHIGWTSNMKVTFKNVVMALGVFAMLNITPENCIYSTEKMITDETFYKKGDSNETDKPA